MTISPLRILVGAVITALAVGTLSTVPSAASTPPSPEPAARDNYQVPKVGSCHRYNLRQSAAVSAPGTAVPCTSKHTARTVFVKRLTGKVDWNFGRLVPQKAVVPCHKAMQRELGGSSLTYLKTTYHPIYFFPTKKQRDRGAKWIRCDIVQYAGRSLDPLPADLKLGNGAVPDSIARCLDREYLLIPCSKSHSWRADAFIRLSGANPPSEAESRRIAVRRCADKVSSRTFRFRPSSAFEWRSGIKGLICYSQTRR